MSPWPQEWEELKATPHKVVSMDGFNHILLSRGVKFGEPWREVFIPFYLKKVEVGQWGYVLFCSRKLLGGGHRPWKPAKNSISIGRWDHRGTAWCSPTDP